MVIAVQDVVLVRTFTFLVLFAAFGAVSGGPARADDRPPKTRTRPNQEAAVAAGRATIRRGIEVLGQDRLKHATVGFEFRGMSFRMTRRDGLFRFQRESAPGATVRAVETLDNAGFRAEINGKPVVLREPRRGARRRSLNSVIYFASIPFVLEDPAVRPKATAPATIRGRTYDTVEVRFTADGGGDDHDDVFVYWFDQKTGRLDYLAYVFHTGEGGVRFRVATDHVKVSSVTFIQWDNYGLPNTGIDLHSLASRWADGKLPKLSTIQLDALTVDF